MMQKHLPQSVPHHDVQPDTPVLARMDALVREFDLGKKPDGGRAILRAVDDVTLAINRQETLGLVGESGSGKSTIGRMLVGLLPQSSGTIELFGQTIQPGSKASVWKPLRRRVQFVFQDPHAALNPRMRVGNAIAEPLDVAGGYSKKQRQACIDELMELVGLPASFARRFPHEFSGGQRQRIVIARALALNPELLVCDEAVASLDVSMQAQIVNLLKDLQDQLGLSYLFIAHDLAVVRAISQRVSVLYAGRIVETASRNALYTEPLHPYTRALLNSVPRARRGAPAPVVAGEVPSLLNKPRGCAFCPRCPDVMPICRETPPALQKLGAREVACHLYS